MEISLTVEQVVFGGKGLCRLEDGRICFVPGVIPGERVLVRIQREHKTYVEADLVRILESSLDRVKPECPVFGRCGGCHYQHMTMSRQLVVKRDQVADVLRRVGGVAEPAVDDVVPSPNAYGYRNRITVHSHRGRVGYFAPKSRKVVEISACPIASQEVNGMLAELLSQPRKKIRDGAYPLREPWEFKGFRQVNDAAGELLQDVVVGLAESGGELLVDAYCGAGFFAKKLREKFRQIIGIEWSPDAVRAAREGVTDAEIYLLGDVKLHLVPALASAPAAETTLLLDPPTEGLEPEILDIIIGQQPGRIIYVSCHPATLARDIKRLAGSYGLRRVSPVDMFPQTAEIEVAVLLEKL